MFGGALDFEAPAAPGDGRGVGRISIGRWGARAVFSALPALGPGDGPPLGPGLGADPAVLATAVVLVGLGFGTPLRGAGAVEARVAGAGFALGMRGRACDGGRRRRGFRHRPAPGLPGAASRARSAPAVSATGAPTARSWRRRWDRRRRHLDRDGDRPDRRDAHRRGGNLVARLRLEDVLRRLGVWLWRLLRNRAGVRRRGRRDLGELVAVGGHAAAPAAARAARAALVRCAAHVRHGRDRARRGRLIRDDDRRRALDRHDLSALHALGRAFLRRAAQDREEQ